ncbi:MAG: tetratricopeptide repeat protein [Campylobacterales bacterium]
MKIIICAIVACLFIIGCDSKISSSIGGADREALNRATLAYQQKNYIAAYNELKPLANKNIPEALYNLGLLYDRGLGTDKNETEAFKLYLKAAEGGHSQAQFLLGFMYSRDDTITKKNLQESLRWYKLSAEQGHILALYDLGVIYYYGKGVTQNFKEALHFFRQSAEKGSTDAQFNLGMMYAKGEGIAQDNAEAYKWFSLASSSGDSEAKNNRDIAASHLSQDQIIKAQDEAKLIQEKIERERQ